MSQYQDLSTAEIFSSLDALTRKSNPTFVVGSSARKKAWMMFSLRLWTGGRIRLLELIELFGHGKKEDEVKKKVKDEAEKEVAASFHGVPRVIEDALKIAPHSETPAGIIDFLTLIQQIFVLDQYHARDFLREDSVVIDAGANIGVFTGLASSIAKKGKVYAFEPASPARKTLEANLKGAANVVIVPFGLGEAKKTEELGVSADFPGQSAFRDTGIDGTGGAANGMVENVAVTTVDDFVKENNIARVDFIKMDTEGYEKNIIRGARETIKKFKPVIAASAYHFPGDKKEIPELILGIEPGYHYKLSMRAEEDYIFWMPQSIWKKIKKNLFKLFLLPGVNRRYITEPAVFEAITSADPKKPFIIVLAFNEPELIMLHDTAMKKFFKDEHEYFVMDNSNKDDRSAEIKKYCLGQKINYVRLPKNPGIDESTNPGLAFNWIYRNLIERFKPEIFGFIDSDLFPTEPVSVIPYLARADAWGVITERKPNFLRPMRRTIWYLWLGLLFFRRERFAGAPPNFLPGEPGIDAGGRVHVDPKEILKLPDVHDLHKEYIWTEVAPGVSIIRYGKFVHFTGASWLEHGVAGQKRWMSDFLKKTT